jgi:hypothetical protein
MKPAHQATDAGKRQHGQNKQAQKDDWGAARDGFQGELHDNKRIFILNQRMWTQFGVAKSALKQNVFFLQQVVRNLSAASESDGQRDG